jgi:hypothetical protein
VQTLIQDTLLSVNAAIMDEAQRPSGKMALHEFE